MLAFFIPPFLTPFWLLHSTCCEVFGIAKLLPCRWSSPRIMAICWATTTIIEKGELQNYAMTAEMTAEYVWNLLEQSDCWFVPRGRIECRLWKLYLTRLFVSLQLSYSKYSVDSVYIPMLMMRKTTKLRTLWNYSYWTRQGFRQQHSRTFMHRAIFKTCIAIGIAQW